MAATVFVISMITILIIVLVVFFLRDPRQSVEHDYFNKLWLHKAGSYIRWEATLDPDGPGIDNNFGILSETKHDEVPSSTPSDEEVNFCKEIMTDLDGLYEKCKPAVEEAWIDWVKTDLPQDWRVSLKFSGFSVPKDGDINNPWGVYYYCEPAGHFFIIKFKSGEPYLESVDG